MSWEKGNQKPLNREDVNKQVLELEGYLEDNKAKYWLYKFLKENITFTTELLTGIDRKSTRLNSSHSQQSRMPSSA